MDYRCFIPMNLLNVLANWKPDAKVMEIHGSGTIKIHSYTLEKHKFISIYPHTDATINIDYNSHELVTNLPTLEDIVDECRKNKVFNGTINLIKLYAEVDKKWTPNKWAALTFRNYTPHRNLDLMRMGNGGKMFAEIPLYTYLSTITEKLSVEQRKRYKKTIMVLEKTQPHDDLLKDFNFINEIADPELYMKGFIFDKKIFTIRRIDAIEPPKTAIGEFNG